MKRIVPVSLLLVPLVCLSAVDAGKKKGEDPKAALQALQEFIGSWKGSGAGKTDVWKETAAWSWRFKGDDAWFSLDIKDGKYHKDGELRYVPAKSKYQLTLTDKKGAKQVFEGEIKKGIQNVLVLERKNPDTEETEQIKLNTAGGGDRLVYTFSVAPKGRSLPFKHYQVGYTKEGVTFGVAEASKKPECVVTGGLGTMTVSYMGATYYVCCSGCRDAFNDNPAKIIAEYKAKKKAGN